MSPNPGKKPIADEETVVPTVEEVRQCQFVGCRNRHSQVRGCREGLVALDDGRTKRMTYTWGFCLIHGDPWGLPKPHDYETVAEYFERTYQIARGEDYMVRAATDEPDKSELLRALGRQVARTIAQGGG